MLFIFLLTKPIVLKTCRQLKLTDKEKKIFSVQMFLRIWIGLFIQQQYFTIATVSFNQPTFPPNSTWNQYATTFANNFTIGTQPYALYVDTNNSIYTINLQNGRILIWMNNSTDPNPILYAQLSSSAYSIFVTTNGQIYVGDSTSIKQIIQFSNSYSNQPHYYRDCFFRYLWSFC